MKRAPSQLCEGECVVPGRAQAPMAGNWFRAGILTGAWSGSSQLLSGEMMPARPQAKRRLVTVHNTGADRLERKGGKCQVLFALCITGGGYEELACVP